MKILWMHNHKHLLILSVHEGGGTGDNSKDIIPAPQFSTGQSVFTLGNMIKQ